MSTNGEVLDSDDAISQLALIVEAIGATDLDDICAILSEKLGCSAEELKAGLTEDPLVGAEPSYDDFIRDIVLGVGKNRTRSE